MQSKLDRQALHVKKVVGVACPVALVGVSALMVPFAHRLLVNQGGWVIPRDQMVDLMLASFVDRAILCITRLHDRSKHATSFAKIAPFLGKPSVKAACLADPAKSDLYDHAVDLLAAIPKEPNYVRLETFRNNVTAHLGTPPVDRAGFSDIWTCGAGTFRAAIELGQALGISRTAVDTAERFAVHDAMRFLRRFATHIPPEYEQVLTNLSAA